MPVWLRGRRSPLELGGDEGRCLHLLMPAARIAHGAWSAARNAAVASWWMVAPRRRHGPYVVRGGLVATGSSVFDAVYGDSSPDWTKNSKLCRGSVEGSTGTRIKVEGSTALRAKVEVREKSDSWR